MKGVDFPVEGDVAKCRAVFNEGREETPLPVAVMEQIGGGIGNDAQVAQLPEPAQKFAKRSAGPLPVEGGGLAGPSLRSGWRGVPRLFPTRTY